MNEKIPDHVQESDDAVEYSASNFADSVVKQIDDEKQGDKIVYLEQLIHRLQFELRFERLTQKQLEHMSERLSAAERCKLNGATEAQRERYIQEFARARYFRRCAWIAYLNGDDPEPPCDP